MTKLPLPKHGVFHSLWPCFAPKDINPTILTEWKWGKSHSILKSIFLVYFYLNVVKVHPIKYKKKHSGKMWVADKRHELFHSTNCLTQAAF